jgi:hypothetical protein
MTARAFRLLAPVPVIVALAAGVLWLGRVAPDDRAAMAYTAGWFALVAGTGYLLTRRRRDLRLPLAAGFLIIGAVVAVVLGRPIITDKEVNERVVTGTPASQSSARDSGRASRARNIELASGTFEPEAHSGSGRAAVVELAGGGRRLTFTEFETSNGPDLFVYLVAGDPQDEGDVEEFKNLGGLKGNKGNQQYVVPDDVDIRRYSTAVVWCRAFTVLFTKARLERS